MAWSRQTLAVSCRCARLASTALGSPVAGVVTECTAHPPRLPRVRFQQTPACNVKVLWFALQAQPGLSSTQVVPQQWVLEASGAAGDGLWAGGTAAADRYIRRPAAAQSNRQRRNPIGCVQRGWRAQTDPKRQQLDLLCWPQSHCQRSIRVVRVMCARVIMSPWVVFLFVLLQELYSGVWTTTG